jgi:N6-adenosine-specific RNA methylase IME4
MNELVTSNIQTAWRETGLRLARTAASVMFEVGDWWNNVPPGIDRKAIVTSEAWKAAGGLVYHTCRNAGMVAKRWPASLRSALPFHHHAVVAALPDAQAIPLLEWAASEGKSIRDVRARVNQLHREAKVAKLAGATKAASAKLGIKLYSVIYADPPWRFEPWSRTTGMGRAADNHYPTIPTEDIEKLKVPAADNCALFLWATAPMLLHGLDVMAAWGFVYRTHFVWVKTGRSGLGYWNRNQHELLLVGVKGTVPAPAPGEQYPSVLEFPAGEHSAKPNAFAEMIEDMFPNGEYLEMFARQLRLSWDVWGNEVNL